MNTFFRKLLKKQKIKGKNNAILQDGSLHNVQYNVRGNNNLIEIKKGATLSNMMIYMRGDNHKLVIGENCAFKGGSVWFEDNNCHIEIGKDTTIESAHLAATEPGRKILIGDDCMFSYSIEFRTGDSHSIIDNETKERINCAQDIIVEDHVWIGAHSIVLKGVSIGGDSVIGIKSLVTKNVPPNSIAAGIPAKVIKNGINWDRKRLYEAFEV